ncbi:MAG: carboxypeptidase-like regulatory domain-containing protein [Acidobacteriota bacterium]|nr:carboxypeptidase-like regulatory domain-containing protein [Acidobacteriota bacterium]
MLKNLAAVSTLSLTFVVLGAMPVLYGQAVSSATVTGRVTDQEGAVMSGVQIKVTGVDTSTVHDVVTNADGLYTITNLPIGPYTFQAAAQGFQTYEQTGALLAIQKDYYHLGDEVNHKNVSVG